MSLSKSKFLLLALGIALCAPIARPGTFTGEDLTVPFTVHGRLMNYLGFAQMRIWVIGSNRILGVDEDSPEAQKIAAMITQDHWFEYAVHGDFTVEPLAPDIKGHKRPIRIIKVTNVVVCDAEGTIVLMKKAL